jgi:hypothetical protein
MSNQERIKLFTLSAKGLATIPWNNYERDFKFKVGTEEYFCPSFVAEFLSPHISNLRGSDCTIQEFELETVDSEKCFKDFVSLGFGLSVSVKSEHISIFRSLCVELGAIEFYEQLFQEFEGEITTQNVCDRLKDLYGLNCLCECEIAFAASHFVDLNSAAISSLNVSLLLQILKQDSLQIQSEDWLFEFILKEISKDPTFCLLLEFVGYEYLSKSSIESFIDLISESFEFLTISIWQSLRSRLISGWKYSTSGRVTQQTFTFRSDSPFEGIISFLTLQHGGNVADCDVVSVELSSVHRTYHAKYAADLNSPTFAHTQDIPNSWICYEFRKMEVNVSHYSLRSRTDCDYHHLMNWTLEGSLDEKNWIQLDCRNDCRDLVGVNQSSTFKTSRSEFVRFVRLRQHGNDSTGRNYLVLSGFELFGALHEF